MPTRTVICLKWGDKYGPEYVNHLHSMVRRNLDNPRFVCFTDSRVGIDTAIECKDIPCEVAGVTGWWLKLSLFQDNLSDLTGPLLYLDLDLLVVNRLEPLFEVPGDFLIIDDWLYARNSQPHKWNSSVMRFTMGQFHGIWDSFLQHRSDIMQRMAGDQDWITEQLRIPTAWPENWCISYKLDQAWANVPQETKLVVFHGNPKPPQAIQGTANIPPAPWIANVWR